MDELPSTSFIIADLIRKHRQQRLTREEQLQLDTWIAADKAHEQLWQEVNDPLLQQENVRLMFRYDENEALGRFLEKHPENQQTGLVHRVHFLRKWGWAAASVLLVMAVAAYFWLDSTTKTQSVIVATKSADIPAGKHGAILTLADGSRLLLDSLKNGVVATQEGTAVLLKDGQISYKADGDPMAETIYNTMSTPKGRQFQLALPDGTMVWLNTASSISYPTAFTGKERKVTITGEAYFEVAKNAQKPFRVNINNKAAIEVLGTHFNVNAYEDEPGINTTLLEGSVKVISGQKNVILKPGQQAQISEETIKVNNDPDKLVIMSWKSSRFLFNFTRLDAALRQLSRWYDVEVVYEKEIPAIEFTGEIEKDLNLSQTLFVLDKLGVRFKVDGKKLIVIP